MILRRLTIFVILGLILAVISPSNPFADAPPPELKIVPGSQHEVLLKESPVSGTLLVGMNIDATSQQIAKPVPLLHVPRTSPGKREICVKMVSSDGLYKWEAAYRIDPTVNGWHRLEYRTLHEEVPQRYLPSDIAVLATMKAGCEDRAGEAYVLPAFWSDPLLIGNQPEINLLVQSAGHETSIKARSASAPPPACKRRSLDERNIAFDTMCSLQLPRDGGGTATESYRITVSSFASKLDSQRFSIIWN